MFIRKLISLSRGGDRNIKKSHELHAVRVTLHMATSLTKVVFHFFQEANALEMFGSGHRQSKNITNGLVESRVGTVTKGYGLLFVLQEILHMTHLMVNRDQVVHRHHGALFDPGHTNEPVSKDTIKAFQTGNKA